MTKSLAVSGAIAVGLTRFVSASYTGPAARQVTGATTEYKYLETPAGKKPRVVITADPELDDNNSMIRTS